MNILVTGSNGQLASCLKVLVEKYGNGHADHLVGDKNYYIFASHNTLDITDADAVKDFVSKNHISVIVNCAAYTNVNKAQEEQELACKVNTEGPKNLATAALSVGAVLIHISTDYVFSNIIKNNTPLPPYDFSGKKYSRARLEENCYGFSKLAGEKYIMESGCRYIIIRTSWLYSSFGKNFVKSMTNMIAAGADLNIVYDQVGSPTSAHDLAEFIYHIIEDNNDQTRYLSKQGIYNFANKGVASWYDIVFNIKEQLCTLDGCRDITQCERSKITPCLSSEFPQPVVRPSYSVLDTAKTSKDFDFTIKYWTYPLYHVVQELYDNIKTEKNV